MVRETKGFIHTSIYGQSVAIRKVDGYVDAKSLCLSVRKQWSDYILDQKTRVFIRGLHEKYNHIQRWDFVEFGRLAIWVHPEIALNLSEWLDDEVHAKTKRLVKDYLVDAIKNVKGLIAYVKENCS